MKLPLTLDHGDGETPSDFASRLATRVYRDNMRDLCQDFCIAIPGLITGQADAVAALADLAGVNPDRLMREAFVQMGDTRRYRHKGQDLLRSSLTRNRVRMCPACMTEDIRRRDYRMAARPHRRSLWLIRGVRTCLEHGMALTEIENLSGPDVIHDVSRAVAGSLPRLPQLLDEATLRPSSAFERYVSARVAGTTNASWLDGLPLYAALQLPRVIGAVKRHGPEVTLEDLTEDQEWHCEAEGFDVVDKGFGSIRAFLDELQIRFPKRRYSGPKTMYGRLYGWLAHESGDPAYDPVRDIIVEHSLDTLPIGPGDTLFGQEIQQRRLHSVHTSSRQSGLHPKRLRKILTQAGLTASDANSLTDNKVIVDCQKADELAGALKETLNLTAMRTYLNVPRPHDQGLVRAELLKPLIDRPHGRSSINYIFRTVDLDAFLAKLLRNADPTHAKNPAFENLIWAAKRCCCTVMDVVQLVLDRKLGRVGRDDGQRGFLSVLVDAAEVRLHVASHREGISLREVEKLLPAQSSAVKALVKTRLVAVKTVKNPVTGRMQPVVMPGELERFRHEYATLHNLSQEWGEHFSRIKKRLVAAGITPVGDPQELSLTIYRRSDLP